MGHVNHWTVTVCGFTNRVIKKTRYIVEVMVRMKVGEVSGDMRHSTCGASTFVFCSPSARKNINLHYIIIIIIEHYNSTTVGRQPFTTGDTLHPHGRRLTVRRCGLTHLDVNVPV